MDYLRKYRTVRTPLWFLSVFAAIILAGCDGGLIGTSEGPTTETTDTYQLKNLPERISPDIPKTLLRGEELSPSQQEYLNIIERNTTSRMDDSSSEKSEGWRIMSDDLGTAGRTRVTAQINSTIIDIAFNDIVNRCEDQPMDCTIPGDQIKVKLTKDVINRFSEIATDLVESLPPGSYINIDRIEAAATIKEQFTLLLDSEVVLGETRYSQLDGAPYNHSVQTFLKRKAATDLEFTALFWQDQGFNVRWREDGTVVKFVFDDGDSAPTEYFYQNNTPSELVIASYVLIDEEGRRPFDFHVKLIANDRSRAGVLVEVATVLATPVEVDGERSTGLSHALVQGQLDNGGGYSIFDGITINIADTRRAVAYTGLRESFDRVGNLIARTGCEVRDFDQGIEVCDEENFVSTGPIGSSITDSPYYFQTGNFDSLVAIQDVIRWKVEGLPAEPRRFAVVSAESAIEPSERELLCWGFQLVSDDSRIFCSATDEQLENTLVLELINGKLGNSIPTARLVQIQ